MPTADVKKIKKALTKPPAPTAPPRPADLLGTGSTLLNLACSGNRRGGFAKGFYYFFVGDSSSGKTFLSLTCLAEAAANKHFGDYRFIYDAPEGGALMNIAQFFGRKVAARLEPANTRGGTPIASETIEDFYFNADDALDDGRPFIYILDSMDALTSRYEQKKLQERKAAARNPKKKAAGDYGDGKAKANASGLRQIVRALPATGSILLILNQTRDNIGGGLFDPKKTRSGGHALTFYATNEMWSSVARQLKRTVREKKRQVGMVARVRVKKNRTNGRDRTVEVPIYYTTGIDDIGGCVDYMVAEGEWARAKDGTITADGLDLVGKRESLVHQIEEAGRENDLRTAVAALWDEIEEAAAIRRKPRYE